MLGGSEVVLVVIAAVSAPSDLWSRVHRQQRCAVAPFGLLKMLTADHGAIDSFRGLDASIRRIVGD